MSDEQHEPDIKNTWTLQRGTNLAKHVRFNLSVSVVSEFLEPTRDEVRSALMQILDEALGPDPSEISTEISGWYTITDPTGEVERLRSWKAEAMEILEQVDRCHALLPPGYQAELGTSKVDAVFRYLHATVD